MAFVEQGSGEWRKAEERRRGYLPQGRSVYKSCL